MAVVKNKLARRLLFILGYIFLALGAVGIFLPVMPTVPFLIVAAWCFVKSSPKTHKWMHEQKHFGPMLKDWETKGAVSIKSKIFAVLAIAASLVSIWYFAPFLWLQVLLTLIILSALVYICTRPRP